MTPPDGKMKTNATEREDEGDLQEFTVYLIRHGEASHNVEEKAAKERVKREILAEGLALDSEEAKRRIKAAQAKVLENPEYFDAPLSVLGFQEAEAAEQRMQMLIQDGHPPPTEVFVSPLQRTLQTAAIIFQDHDNIRVREELRERLTGRPADNRMCSEAISRRQTFGRFSFRQLRKASQLNIASLAELAEFEETEDFDLDPMPDPAKLFVCASSFNAETQVEDAKKLAERTKALLQLIGSSKHKHETFAVVTHKGYLRELERNCFGNPDATEFQNCEVRVYKLTVNTSSGALESAKRIK